MEIIHMEEMCGYVIVGMDFLPSAYFNSLVNLQDLEFQHSKNQNKTKQNKFLGTISF